MVLATLLWGGTFVIIRDSLAFVPPGPLVFARFAVATTIYAIALALRRRRPIRRGAWSASVAAGIAMSGGFLCQAIGLGRTPAGTSAFLTCTGTLLAALYAWPLLGQRPNRALTAGLVLAFAGCALLSLHGGLRFDAGERWTLLGAALFAAQIVAIAFVDRRTDPLAVATIQSAVLVVTLLPFAPGAFAALRAIHGAQIWRFAYLAVAGSVIAPLLQILAQRRLPPGRVALMFALEPVFAVIIAVGVGGEHFGGRWWLGALLILIGVAGVEWNASRSVAA